MSPVTAPLPVQATALAAARSPEWLPPSTPATESSVQHGPRTVATESVPSLTLPAQRTLHTSPDRAEAADPAPEWNSPLRQSSQTSIDGEDHGGAPAVDTPRRSLPLLALQPLALATVRPAILPPAHSPTPAPTPAPAPSPPAAVQRATFRPSPVPEVQRLELPLHTPAPTTTPAPAWVDPAAAAVASGLATRAPDGSVVFTAPPDDPATATVQRQGEATATSAPTTAPAPAAAAGGTPAGGAQSNDQVDELAKRVYDTIRQRLKAELRLDRERSGRLTDLSR